MIEACILEPILFLFAFGSLMYLLEKEKKLKES